MPRRYFAIRTNKFVEIRSHNLSPNKHSSKLKIEKEDKQLDWSGITLETDAVTGRYVFRNSKPPIVTKVLKEFEHVFYSGGRFIKSLTYRRFKSLTKVSLKHGQMVELTPVQADYFTRRRAGKCQQG